MKMRRHTLGLILCGAMTLLSACKHKQADLILINGMIHSMDSKGTVTQACAIREGKVVALGRSEDLLFEYTADSVWDLQGMNVFPGFIDAHCHFYGYAMNKSQPELVGTDSWVSVMMEVDTFAAEHPEGWIIGRGWDQNDWPEKEFPTNEFLNAEYPDRPVFLKRVDGHAAIANQAALDLAGISASTRVKGGKVVLDRNNRPTGLLIDNAMTLVEAVIPQPGPKEIAQALIKAERDLFKVGLTTVDDAGLDWEVIQLIDSLQKAGQLRIRVYAMASPTEENFEHLLSKGPYKTDRLNVCSFKVYADGALGSRGACLIAPYKDVPKHYGAMLQDADYYTDLAERLYQAGFQMNTHAIGDSANRFILDTYGQVLKGRNDRRWRIEHAQVVHPNDFEKFAAFSVIPSVQPIHATSDMYWAEDRLGKDRLLGAYAYKTLLQQNGMIAFGTDFPVEHINPMLGLYASTERVDTSGFPYGGFLIAEAVSRDTALKAMTIWAAYSNFEEKEKGSLEPGKFADFVVLSENPLTTAAANLYKIRTLYTVLGGEIVYSPDSE